MTLAVLAGLSLFFFAASGVIYWLARARGWDFLDRRAQPRAPRAALVAGAREAAKRRRANLAAGYEPYARRAAERARRDPAALAAAVKLWLSQDGGAILKK
ncbi:MAG: hypothetical protein HY804_00370 [Nitrospinae bacterium]|nr:hypothetical protein [Nitrospinota bacterium]